MTSREDRELGIMKIFEEQARVSVYTRTQLIEEGCNGCLHLDPAQWLPTYRISESSEERKSWINGLANHLYTNIIIVIFDSNVLMLKL